MSPAGAVTHLKRGEEAPAIALADLDGRAVNTAELRGSAVVLVFGELLHTRTRQACEQLQQILQDGRLRDQKVIVVLVVTQDSRAEDPKIVGPGQPWPKLVVHDKDRRAFGAYQVAALPSVVIVDGQGRVVHAFAGPVERFTDVLTDGLLLAVGKLSVEQFERTLNPAPTTGPSEEYKRAERLTQLAGQLARRGMAELAAEKYAEALKVDGRHESAHLGMGLLLLRQGRLAEAEVRFRTVLSARADSQEAALGLAFVQMQRGGEELAEAERTVREVLARNPVQPRAYYLLGLIHERRDQPKEAAAAFTKSAELLLERGEPGPGP